MPRSIVHHVEGNNHFTRFSDDSDADWCNAMSDKWPDASQALKTALANPSFVEPRVFLGYLTKPEFVWASLQPYLLSRGYQLRPRYRAESIPSWKDHFEPIKSLRIFEDSILSRYEKIFDAVRTSDGCKVILQVTLVITNRSVPLLDVIPLPDTQSELLLVMPQLLHFEFLPFRRFGEFVEAVEQFLQSAFASNDLNYCRDACFMNLMMDPSKVIPRGSHFVIPHTHDGVTMHFEWKDRWSVRPVKYYFIDFELSKYYPDDPIETFPGLCGQDRTVPELLVDKPYNPFKLDIFQLGNVFMEVIDVRVTSVVVHTVIILPFKKYDGLESLLPLARAMTNSNPEDRPSPSCALEMLGSFNTEDLESRVWQKSCSLADRRGILIIEHAERGIPYPLIV
ncbi:hypothetical protein H0H92_009687 [Tricholoma furcatifolium]|nr:hypothetical protein H0H92_009687 [Tricholoma furcatifolium]